MKVPLIKPDLPSFAAVEDSIREVLETGKVTNFGRYLNEFERETETYIGTKTLAVSSGTIALTLTLQALGIKPGEKVVLPSFTFMATGQAVLYAGGVPLFCDVNENGNLSAEYLERLLKASLEVAAVIPVHLYGLPCDVSGIQGVVERARERSGRAIHLIYDAAHAFGSMVDGKRIGNFGDAEVFSLSITKALNAVEGGLVVSHRVDLIERIQRMRNYGMAAYTYNASLPGLNGKMSEIHAIIGLYNLQRLDQVLCRRREKAAYYARQIEEKTPFKTIPLSPRATHTFKDFTLIFPKECELKRNEVMDFLREEGIETRAYFDPPLHKQEFFHQFADRPLPVTEDLSRRVMTVPFYTTISEEEMDYVVEALKRAVEVLV